MTVAWTTPRRSRAMDLLRGLTWGLAAVFVAGIIAVEWWYWPRESPLSPDWTASVVTIAGDGVVGRRDGTAASSRFTEPFGIAASPDGTLFVADAGETPAIRVITPEGRVFTLAGGTRGFRDGRGAEARFDTPSGIALDGTGAVIVADTANNAIRRVTADGQVTTIAGGGAPGFADGDARLAQFNGPVGVAVDVNDGRILVADTYNDRIRSIDKNGVVATIAGSARGFQDGSAAAALFDTPSGIAVAPDGTIVVADTGNGAIRLIDASGSVTTPPHAPGMSAPVSVAVDERGEVFVADERGRIVGFPLRGDAASTDQIRGRTIAGSRSGFRDGAGLEAEFRRPSGIAILSRARLAVADTGNALVRLAAEPSAMPFVPPASPHVQPAFDIAGFGQLPLLWPVAPLDGPFEIAGTLGEARGSAAERLHGGVDIRLPQGTPVRAVRNGVVESPVATGSFGTLNEWMRIGGVSYVHVRVGRSRDNTLVDSERFVGNYNDRGRLAGIRVKRGARFVTGEVIASINPFNHVHLTVGWPGEEFNPLDYRLVNFEDSIPPTIPANGVRLYAVDGTPLADRVDGRVIVHGTVRVVVEAYDQAEGNQANRRLGPYALGYQILLPSGDPVPGFEQAGDSIVFDRFAGDRTAANLIYAPGSGIPFYSGGRTRFLYTVTNTLRGGVATEGAWNASALAAGDYTLRVWATDAARNTTTRDIPVRVQPTP